MSEDVSVRFLNQEEVLRQIRELAAVIGVEHGRPQKVVAIEALKGIQNGFREQVSPEGIPWFPLKYRDGKTLQDHRVLYHSITSSISGPTVTVGTNDKRANLLHFGGRVKPTHGGYLAIPQPGYTNRGPLREAWPNAFVLKLGGKSYGNDRLWLVQKDGGEKDPGRDKEAHSRGANRNSFTVKGHGRLQFIALLVKWVDEPGRPFIGLSHGTQDAILTRMMELARKAWETGNAPDSGA